MDDIDALNASLTAIDADLVGLGGTVLSDILNPVITGFSGLLQTAAEEMYARKIVPLVQGLQDETFGKVVKEYNYLCGVAGVAGIAEINFLPGDAVEDKLVKVLAAVVDIEAGYATLGVLPCQCGASPAGCIGYSPGCKLDACARKTRLYLEQTFDVCRRVKTILDYLDSWL